MDNRVFDHSSRAAIWGSSDFSFISKGEGQTSTRKSLIFKRKSKRRRLLSFAARRQAAYVKRTSNVLFVGLRFSYLHDWQISSYSSHTSELPVETNVLTHLTWTQFGSGTSDTRHRWGYFTVCWSFSWDACLAAIESSRHAHVLLIAFRHDVDDKCASMHQFKGPLLIAELCRKQNGHQAPLPVLRRRRLYLPDQQWQQQPQC